MRLLFLNNPRVVIRGIKNRFLSVGRHHKGVIQMAREQRLSSYIEQLCKFQDWLESSSLPCPICGVFTNTAVKTDEEIIYLHSDGDMCAERYASKN
jgi:hypothetical protein